MYKLPDAPSSLGGILDDGFKLFKASWKKLLPLAIVASLIGAVPQIIVAQLQNIRPGEMPGFTALGVGAVATIIVMVLPSLTGA